MTHRHYGVRGTKQPATHTEPVPGDPLSIDAIIGGIVAMMIGLGVVLYGVSKIVRDAENTAASAPRTTGEGSSAPATAPSGPTR
jgi:hypothetical protein